MTKQELQKVMDTTYLLLMKVEEEHNDLVNSGKYEEATELATKISELHEIRLGLYKNFKAAA